MTEYHVPEHQPPTTCIEVEDDWFDPPQKLLLDEATGLTYERESKHLIGYFSYDSVPPEWNFNHFDQSSKFVVVCEYGNTLVFAQDITTFELEGDDIPNVYAEAEKCYQSKIDSGIYETVYIVNVEEDYEHDEGVSIHQYSNFICKLWHDSQESSEEEEESRIKIFDYEGKTYLKKEGEYDIFDFSTQEKIGTLVDDKVVFDQTYIDEMAQE